MVSIDEPEGWNLEAVSPGGVELDKSPQFLRVSVSEEH